jgi:hypothetical protein
MGDRRCGSAADPKRVNRRRQTVGLLALSGGLIASCVIAGSATATSTWKFVTLVGMQRV